METQTSSATSGANDSTSGGSEDTKVKTETRVASTSGDTKPEDSDSGKVDLISKMKKEKDNYAKRVLELQKENEEKEAKLKELSEKSLIQNQDFKTLYEQEKEARLKVQQELEAKSKNEIEALKKSAVRSHLLKLGLNPEHEKTALRLMNTTSVVVDKETKAVIGSEEAAKTFYDEFKSLGFFGRSGPGVSHDAPSNDGETVSLKGIKTQKEFDAYLKKKYGN